VPPLVGGVTWVLLNTGPWMPLQLWLFVLAVAVLMMYAYPNLIAPLFNTCVAGWLVEQSRAAALFGFVGKGERGAGKLGAI